MNDIKTLSDILSNGINVSIKDGFMPIDFLSTLAATLIATLFGAGITLVIFKKQEKIRIKEDLNIEAFKEYKNIYSELKNSVRDFLIQAIDELGQYMVKYNGKINENNFNLNSRTRHQILNDEDYINFKNSFETMFKLQNKIFISFERIISHLEASQTLLSIDYKNQYDKIREKYKYIVSDYSKLKTYIYLQYENFKDKKATEVVELFYEYANKFLSSNLEVEKLNKEISSLHQQICKDFYSKL